MTNDEGSKITFSIPLCIPAFCLRHLSFTVTTLPMADTLSTVPAAVSAPRLPRIPAGIARFLDTAGPLIALLVVVG